MSNGKKRISFRIDIPWYRNLIIRKRPNGIDVARVCISCGKIIENPDIQTRPMQYHLKCWRKLRSKISQKHYRATHEPIENRPCIDCGDWLEEGRARYHNIVRCHKCETPFQIKRFIEYQKYIKETHYIRPSKCITVAVTCIKCDTIVPTGCANKKWCDKCDRKEILHPL